MIYLVGTIGFICGFFLGQLVLMKILSGVPRDELLDNKTLHWKYGLLNWGIALLTAASSVWLYNIYMAG